MGTNKKRKKKQRTKMIWTGKSSSFVMFCSSPLCLFSIPRKRKKDLEAALKVSHIVVKPFLKQHFFFAFCVFTDGPFMTSGFRVGRFKMTPKDWMLLGKKCWTWWVKNHQKIVVINGRSQLARWRCFIQNVMGITQKLKDRNTFSKII